MASRVALLLLLLPGLFVAAPDTNRLAGLEAAGPLCPVITHVGIFGDVTTLMAGGKNLYFRKGAEPWRRVPIDLNGAHSVVQLPNGRWLVGDTDNHRLIELDDLANPDKAKTVIRTELAGYKLKRPHDELVDPHTGDVYVIDGERHLFRFKDLAGPVEVWAFTPDEMGYVRALSWFDDRLHVILSSRGEVIRIESFAEHRYTRFRSPRPSPIRVAKPSTQVLPQNSRDDVDAGALATTGLVLNDVEKHGDWYYGTNFFLAEYAPGVDVRPARLIRWRSWDDFEHGKWEDLSTNIPAGDPPAVPYFMTIHGDTLYVPVSRMPDDRCEHGTILQLNLTTLGSTFTIAVIPDTQNYVDYTHQKAAGYPIDASAMFFEQMSYIAHSDAAFAIALGDVWQHAIKPIDPEHQARGFNRVDGSEPTPQVFTVEIPIVKHGYAQLAAAKLPFAVVPGNHDYDATWSSVRFPHGPFYAGGLTAFQSVFSDRSDFFRDKPWYVASHDGGADSAQIFTAGGYRFLHIGLQFDPPNDSLDWAASVIHKFSGVPTIVSTHDYIDPAGARLAGPIVDNHAIDPEHNNTPQMVWDKFISQHDQIFMVLCGHRSAQGRHTARNRAGHEVYELLSDYQDRWHAAQEAGLAEKGMGLGDGWLRLMTFDMSVATPTVHVRTYSTHYHTFSTENPNYAAWYKAAERPNETDAQFQVEDDFTFALTDFRERFGK